MQFAKCCILPAAYTEALQSIHTAQYCVDVENRRNTDLHKTQRRSTCTQLSDYVNLQGIDPDQGIIIHPSPPPRLSVLSRVATDALQYPLHKDAVSSTQWSLRKTRDTYNLTVLNRACYAGHLDVPRLYHFYAVLLFPPYLGVVVA